MHFEYRKSAIRSREMLQLFDSYCVLHSALIMSTTVDQLALLAER